MTINMPEEFEDCDNNVIEFLDGGSDDGWKLASAVIGLVSEVALSAAFVVAPMKLGWFGGEAKATENAAVDLPRRSMSVSLPNHKTLSPDLLP